ncbi:unnamed protein product [Larinioides sclopetarius]|uniref:Uncharacterized protein n=1 Tax=Larinioides sclopetarius TaxID=280406 RepID=A0AAV2BZ69_9ARAC
MSSSAIASLLPDFIYTPVNSEECKEVSRIFFNICWLSECHWSSRWHLCTQSISWWRRR